jgi:hypothetical protein
MQSRASVRVVDLARRIGQWKRAPRRAFRLTHRPWVYSGAMAGNGSTGAIAA